ncbi:Sister chromatid cohesion protein pds5 [Coniosporium tulheliwenetii]|uniref:Sister chromatid cohesion protein pds5 n=1 Tax=Coniosporium tulheliwenetii TaxID=3383036 RepID=A0ACC2YVL9_9PEZI|nr:Sister chromatid cohesion protein pds5 [Cladosporium sp. JES 115]
MPGTRTRGTAAVEVEDAPKPTSTLHFNEPLTWRAGKPIPVGELLKRLKALQEELCEMDQEEADREALMPVAKELASHNLIAHKDRGVRAWTACNIVDMFRLCAPDAPYTAAQLKDIFTLFVTTIFPALADPSNPYNNQHIYVLKSLAEVKSIVLLTDIPSSSNLILHLFTACFDVLSTPSKAENGEELSKNVEHHMTAVLATLVDESQGLPAEVVDVILAQFLRADPRAMSGESTLLLKEAPPAYNMAKNICNACPEKMARYISQYFSSVIIDASSIATNKPGRHRASKRGSSPAGESDDEGPHGPSEEDLHETKKAHRLLRELWRSAPSVLSDIVPQLETELGADDVQLRLLATETLGDMVSGIGAAGPPPPSVLNPAAYPSQSLAHPSDNLRVYNFLTTPTSPHSFPSRYRQAYQSFLSHRNDRSAIVRSAWATSAGRILMTSAGGVGLDPEDERRLIRDMADMLVDVDERVRLAAIQAIGRFDFNDIVRKLGSMGGVSEPGSILHNLAERVKDKKPNVRTEAMDLLGKIWGVAAGAIAEGDDRISQTLGAIPSRILDTYYVNSPEVNAHVDRVLYESLFPLAYPPIKAKPQTNGASQRVKDSQQNGDHEPESDADRIRVERALVLIRGLEPKAKTILYARAGQQQASLAKYMDMFLKKCEDYNGGIMEEGEKEIKQHLTRLIDFYSKTLPNPAQASDDLWKFAKMHDRRSYQLIRFAMAPDSNYKKVHRAIKEIIKRIEDSSSASGTMVETLTPLLYRTSILLYNRSHVPAIIDYTRTDEKGFAETAHEVLTQISTHNPEVFKAHVQDLCKALEDEAPTADKPNAPGAVADLKACAGFARRFPDNVPKDRKFMQSLVSYAKYGTPKAAKYGVSIILSGADKKEMLAKDLLKYAIKGFEFGKGNYLARLATLSQLMLHAPPEVIEEEIDAVIDIAINHVLLKARIVDPESEDGAAPPDWTDEPDENTVAKTWALKILVNRLRSLKDQEPVKEVADPVYKLLNALVAKRGELSKKNDSLPAQKSWLCLLAAQLLLKLSRQARFDSLLSPKDFNQLATVAQLPQQRVRDGFIKKLMKYLGQGQLPKRFYTIVFLLAHEPSQDIKGRAVTWLRARASAFAKQKDTAMEALFARFLSLRAHHPDFTKDVKNLKDEVTYILFYLKCVANQDNLPLIFHVAQRVKSVQDGINPDMSENLYLLSDLSQEVIRRFQEQHGWTMQAWPGKIRMPAGLFAALPSHEVAQEIAQKNYVPEEAMELLDDWVKEGLRTKKRKSEANGDHRAKKRKASTSNGTSRPKAVPKSKTSKASKGLKTPVSKKTRKFDDTAPSSEIRRSARGPARKNYAESSDEDEDADVEMQDQGSEEEESRGGADDSEESQSEPEPQKRVKSSKKAEPKAKSVKSKASVDVETQCAVPLPNGARCTRDLTCPRHSLSAKRAVPGRSAPFDQLLAQSQKKAGKSNGVAKPNGKGKEKEVYDISSDEELSEPPDSDEE